MATTKKKAAARPRDPKQPAKPPTAGQSVHVSTNLKDISVGKNAVKITFNSFKTSMKESIQIVRWIDSEEPVMVTFNKAITAATIITESKVSKESNVPKFNGLKLSSGQVSELMRILQSDSGAVEVRIVPDTLGLFKKQMDEEDGFK